MSRRIEDPFSEYGAPIKFPLPRRPTLTELEALLNSEEDVPITILPNGEIAVADTFAQDRPKPITMRENLGGEYVS